ncbi:Signal recognition particle subunit SRP68 [Trichinella pseudospiralis]|uniref:Signal recognition particle subunit SRP68 n=1 Tax=Trichinella pseudospiralis TaxID=6337 RepID=A0A0V1FM27_TRIPS|nr:Signal recognition particle subunit SRP68 [Trichinella pseudospiralis]KRY74989.1 Signal recognition particle subunit SRP68 [Trichinella pseudospiralis]KRY86815.1 Signal recognition particle subunit SRP68 [Trichinella pseudospiralis]
MAEDCSSVHILQIIKEAQQQHGLRHGDYLRYRQYCSRKLQRVRKSMNVTCIHKPRTFQYRKFSAENLTDARYITIPLFEAERCWAYGMQLKQEATTDSRKRFQMLRKLRRAVYHGVLLETLSKNASVIDAATKLEAQAYKAWLQGCYEFEQKNWTKANEFFTTSKMIYENLSSVTKSSRLVELYRQRCNEMAPHLRFCAFSIGDSTALADLMQMRMKISDEAESLMLSELDNLLTECRQKQSISTETEIVWCDHRVDFAKPVRVCTFCNSLRDFQRQVEETSDYDGKLALYEQLLSDCRDAIQSVREEAKGENFKLKRAQDGEKQEVFSNANLLYLYLTYVRLTKSTDRYNMMIEAMQKKGAKSQDLIRLYDSILQNFAELQQLPLIKLDQCFADQMLYFRTLRCFHVAEIFYSQKKWPEALALYQRTVEYINELKQSAAWKSEQNVYVSEEQLKALLMSANKGKYQSHARCLVQGEKEETMKTLVDEEKVIPIIESLDTFRNYTPADLKGRIKLVPIPPSFMPIPCKPLFFDLALNYVRFPSSLDETLDEMEPNKQDNKAGGLSGFVKGLLWGAKKK